MKPFRSVGARLSAALALAIAVALVIAYAIVVPPLEESLVDSRLEQLTRTAVVESRGLPNPGTFVASPDDAYYQFTLDEYLAEASQAAKARVVLVQPLAAGRLKVIGDSHETADAPDISDDEVALAAALRSGVTNGIVEHDEGKFAEVAFFVPTGFTETTVLLFSAPLEETLANIELVKRRVLVAGIIGLLVAVVLGYGGASFFARRLRRLERAADRIAGGRLDEPVVDAGSDEVAELARAFERMRQRLAQLEHARREFIANASHELRTPIFSLGGFLELLADEDLDDATRQEFLGTMQEQVERLTKLATDLLDLSRLDAGRLRVERERVDLDAIAEVLQDEFAGIARTTGHPLELDAGEAAALGDDQRVLQIGRILVENAIRHTPSGTRVRIRAGRRGGRAELTVEDDGPGIPSEHAEQVFERFYRVEGGVASGSGLGLAIARELAELMGGTVELAAAGGRTIFTLALPAGVLAPGAVEALAAG